MELKVKKTLCVVSSVDNKKVKFIQNLISLFDTAIINISSAQELPKSNLDDLIILWDLEKISLATNNIDSLPETKHILFNAVRSKVNEQNLLAAGFHGVLYEDDSAPLIIKGINLVGNGQLWFSRSTLSELTLSFLSSNKNNQAEFCQETIARFEKLTTQESLIIQRLIEGYKNKEIANDFSISEHTVKSHLYSIYKKIKVRNRVHAINLARKFMPLLQS